MYAANGDASSSGSSCGRLSPGSRRGRRRRRPARGAARAGAGPAASRPCRPSSGPPASPARRVGRARSPAARPCRGSRRDRSTGSGRGWADRPGRRGARRSGPWRSSSSSCPGRTGRARRRPTDRRPRGCVPPAVRLRSPAHLTRGQPTVVCPVARIPADVPALEIDALTARDLVDAARRVAERTALVGHLSPADEDQAVGGLEDGGRRPEDRPTPLPLKRLNRPSWSPVTRVSVVGKASGRRSRRSRGSRRSGRGCSKAPVVDDQEIVPAWKDWYRPGRPPVGCSQKVGPPSAALLAQGDVLAVDRGPVHRHTGVAPDLHPLGDQRPHVGAAALQRDGLLLHDRRAAAAAGQFG